MEPDNLRRSWCHICQTAGISNVRFHDIRQTCVSLPLDLKVPLHIVREIVGHSDIELTMTIYAHASLDEKRAERSGPQCRQSLFILVAVFKTTINRSLACSNALAVCVLGAYRACSRAW